MTRQIFLISGNFLNTYFAFSTEPNPKIVQDALFLLGQVSQKRWAMEMPAHGFSGTWRNFVGKAIQTHEVKTKFLPPIKLDLAQQRVFCAGGPCEPSSREINKNIVGASVARNV